MTHGSRCGNFDHSLTSLPSHVSAWGFLRLLELGEFQLLITRLEDPLEPLDLVMAVLITVKHLQALVKGSLSQTRLDGVSRVRLSRSVLLRLVFIFVPLDLLLGGLKHQEFVHAS